MKRIALIAASLLLASCVSTPDYCRATAARSAGSTTVDRCIGWEIKGSSPEARKFRQEVEQLGLGSKR